MKLTVIIEREENGYIALCPELDIASQGDDMPAARASLQKAVEMFLDSASTEEVGERLAREIFITHIHVADEKILCPIG